MPDPVHDAGPDGTILPGLNVVSYRLCNSDDTFAKDFGARVLKRMMQDRRLQLVYMKNWQVGSSFATSVPRRQQPPPAATQPHELDFWELIEDYDEQALEDDLRRLKDKIEDDFDHLQMAWWKSNRVVNSNNLGGPFRHDDTLLKALLRWYITARPVTAWGERRESGDRSDVLQKCINFLKRTYRYDRVNEQGVA